MADAGYFLVMKESPACLMVGVVDGIRRAVGSSGEVGTSERRLQREEGDASGRVT